MSNDHIFIIGAGAVGKALAVFLQMKGAQVTVIRGSLDDRSSYRQPTHIRYNNEQEFLEEIQFSTLSNFSHLKGLIVLTNKSYGNPLLAQKLVGKVDGSPLVILQNGLGVEEPFIKQGFPNIYRGVLFLASQTLSENRISYNKVADSPIGITKVESPQLEDIVIQLSTAQLTFRPESEIPTIIWEKAILNSVFNSICPLLEIDNGIFHRHQEVWELAKRVIRECVSVAHAYGINLDAQAIQSKALVISKASDGQVISTLQDIRNGRETEIDTLNLKIAALANDLNKEDLVTETKLLGELTLLKSQIAMQAQASGTEPSDAQISMPSSN